MDIFRGIGSIPRANLFVRVGNTKCSQGGALHKVKRSISHEKYVPSPVFDYDFALVELTDNIQFNDKVKPIKLADGKLIIHEGQMCLVSGWGDTHTDESMEPLRSVEVPKISPRDCVEDYNRLTMLITPRMICAGYNLGGKDACQGKRKLRKLSMFE